MNRNIQKVNVIIILHLSLLSLSTLSVISIYQIYAQTSTLLDDNFDSENSGKDSLNYNSFRNWYVLMGTVDIAGDGLYEFLPVDGLYIDLDGSSGDPGKLVSKSNFNLQPANYILQFDLAGSQGGVGEIDKDTDTVQVSLGSVYKEEFTLNWDDPIKTISRNITVLDPTTGRLIFAELTGGDDRGLLLDNVKLIKL